MADPHSEWAIIEKLLPEGWRSKAKELGAFIRATHTKEPGALLRLLLFHAANDGGMRDTVAQAEAAGLHSMSGVALLKRLDTSGAWLRWIASQLAAEMRGSTCNEKFAFRPRVIDGTCIQSSGVTQPDWRLHYTLDLMTLDCDWHELHEGKVGEGLELAPVSPGDVLLGDRNFLTHRGAQWVTTHGGHLVVRLRWSHPVLLAPNGKKVNALTRSRKLRVNEVGEWPVNLTDPETGTQVPGRLISLRLPLPLAQKAVESRVRKQSKKNKSKKPDARSIEACKYIFVFTTLPRSALAAKKVLELYRLRWQVELAFKRLKQILQIGWVPHRNRERAATWVMAKMILALLLEKLHRKAMTFSPWGYALDDEEGSIAEADRAEPVEEGGDLTQEENDDAQDEDAG
jgi:hypothetical protein